MWPRAATVIVCGEELSRETITVAALGHTYGDAVVENNVAPTCTVDGSYDNVTYCTVCGEELNRETITVDALGHTEIVDEAIEPTCTETGLTEGKHCSVCNEVIVAQEIVAPFGHTAGNAVVENSVEPDCVNNGSYESVVYCTACGVEISRETIVAPATGHNFTDYKSNNDATYTEDGTMTGTCANCGLVDTKIDEGSALGLAQKFKDEMAVLAEKETVSYDDLYAIIQTYSTLTDTDKSEAEAEFAELQKMINEYNAKAQIANNELAEASEIALAAIVPADFAFLAALWFLLKKKFFI